jgi:hypothetical protein
MALQPFVGPWPLLQFRNNFYTDGRAPWTSDQPVARPLPKHRTTQTKNKRTQTSTPRVGFEPTIPVFQRAKIVHALDRVATVIGNLIYSRHCSIFLDPSEALRKKNMRKNNKILGENGKSCEQWQMLYWGRNFVIMPPAFIPSPCR